MDWQELVCPTDKRIYAVAAALNQPSRWTLTRLSELTRIDSWFLYQMNNIIRMIGRLARVDCKVGVAWGWM